MLDALRRLLGAQWGFGGATKSISICPTDTRRAARIYV